jgi:alpha-L-arabinofuranosidase
LYPSDSIGPASRPLIEAIQAMGVGFVRYGGTVAQTIQWKQWRGAPWERGAMQHAWAGGIPVSVNWGPFEMLEAAQSILGIPAMLSLARDLNTADDFADLVEYAYGDENTPWGAVRIRNDSHPAPYQLTLLELGNEEFAPDFVPQILAMEARRARVGAPPITYFYPSTGGPNNSQVAALLAAGVPAPAFGPDCHASDAVSCAKDFFGKFTNTSAVNAEVNGRFSNLERMILESTDLVRFWFNASASVAELVRAPKTHDVKKNKARKLRAD